MSGAADRFGSEMPIGFRTSQSSTGLFNLIGTHSIGDMLDAHSAAPFDARFERFGGLGIDGASLPRPSAAKPVGHVDSTSSQDGQAVAELGANAAGLGRGPESTTDAALFTLTMTVPAAGGQMTLYEEGVVSFPHDWDVNSPNYPITVEYRYTYTFSSGGDTFTESDSVTWSGNASPNGQLAGYDIDEDNTSRFGMDWAQATYYRLEYAGSSTFVAIESGTRVEQVDGRTITRHYDNELHGIDVFSYSSEGTGAGLAVVWDCTTDAVFDNSEHGTDVRVATSDNPIYWSGVFANTAQGTQQEIDHFEGTLIPRGAFTLAQFSIEQIGNCDFTGAGSGAGGSPLPGGGLTNNYTNQNQGQNSFQLSASGSPDDWIGSLADNTQSTFSDSDSGSASTTVSTEGQTETDSGTFSLTETGSHAETLSLSGDGDEDSFTITALTNHINDQFQFHGANGGTATYQSATENGSDSYHHTDDGTANEVLTLTGTAAALAAAYTNNISNGFTDTSNGNSNWSIPSPGGGSESGSVNSVNSDSGSGNVHVSVTANMDAWQFGESGEWDIDNVTISGGGLANVSSSDDGQASVIAADPNDTLSSDFNGSAAGTDSYSFGITGDGTDFTLTNRDLVNLNLNNADTDLARWSDPGALNGQATVTTGQQTVNFDDLSQATVDVQASRALSAGRGPGGGPPPVTGTVDIQSNGGFTVGAVGSEQDYGGAANHMENGINNSINMGQNVRVQTVMGANGRTTSVDHSLNGALNLNGWHNQTNALDPSQSAYEQGSGHLGGNVSGRLLSAGLVRTDGSTQADPSSGDFSVDINGNTTNSVIVVYDTFLDPTLTPPSIGFEPVAAVEPLAFPPAMHPGGVLPTGAIVTVTHSISVPQFSLRARDEQAAGNWSLDDLEYSQTTVETTSIFGDYTNCLLYPGGSGHAERTETERTEIELDSPGGSATGNMRVTTTVVGSAQATIAAPNYTGSASVSINLTTEDRVSGGMEGVGADVTELITESGTSSYRHHLTFTAGGFERFRIDDLRNYSQANALIGENSVLTAARGTDSRTVYTNSEYRTATTITSLQSVETSTVTHSVGMDNQVLETPTHTLVGWITITDIPSGTSQSYPLEPPPPPQPEERPWYQFAVDFAAGMADSLTCGLTARARDALGLGSLVDTNSGWYTGGEVGGTVLGLAIPGPCGKAGLIKGAINGLRATQGAGSAINAAEAVRAGDAAGFLLGMGGAAFSFSRFNACFAAGTPIPAEHGCKAIEQIREGDIVLMRNEHDPVAPPIKGRVLSTFSTTAPVWELRAGGQALRTTAGHPFWVRGKGWTAAVDLRPGQELRTDTDWVVVEDVCETGESATVYNFEVEGEHTYFAGDPVTWGWCLWAHNAGCRPIRSGRMPRVDRFPVRDSTRRIHDNIPTRVPTNWRPGEIQDAIAEVRGSIAQRIKNQGKHGMDQGHAFRIALEQNWLRQLQDRLREIGAVRH